MAEGYEDPDLRTGSLDIVGCVSRRQPRVQLISLGALKSRMDSRMLFSERMDSIAKYTFAPRAIGIPRILAEFGN